MVVDLVTDDGLRKAANSALEKHRESSGKWLSNLRKHLEKIRDADEALFLSEAFQRQLWDEEAVSATGMGNINVSFLYSDPRVAQFLWELKGIRQNPLQDHVVYSGPGAGKTPAATGLLTL